jgi:hypothetical protein
MQSLHEQGRCFQLKYCGEQTDELLHRLDDFIEATEQRAPVRIRAPYPLKREEPGTPHFEEARWERAIWKEWHDARPMSFVPGVCRSVVSYQVMLRDENKRDEGWGEVDLLGRSETDRPVVIELKGASSNEPPLRGIVEGLTYAIAVRKAWIPCLRQQWYEALKTDSLEMTLLQVPIIFAAPAEYWEGVTGRRAKAGVVPRPAWQSLQLLMKALRARNMPVSLVRLEATNVAAPSGISGYEVDVATLLLPR